MCINDCRTEYTGTASEVNNLANKTSNLKNQLDGLNQDLVAISDKISATQKKIDQSDNEVYRLEASLKISYNNEEKQYENMKTRIKYMYENGSSTMLTLLLKADSMADFLNKADFIENVTEYDRNMLENIVKVRKGIEKQEKDLKKQQQELVRSQESDGQRRTAVKKQSRCDIDGSE